MGSAVRRLCAVLSVETRRRRHRPHRRAPVSRVICSISTRVVVRTTTSATCACRTASSSMRPQCRHLHWLPQTCAYRCARRGVTCSGGTTSYPAIVKPCIARASRCAAARCPKRTCIPTIWRAASCNGSNRSGAIADGIDGCMGCRGVGGTWHACGRVRADALRSRNAWLRSLLRCLCAVWLMLPWNIQVVDRRVCAGVHRRAVRRRVPDRRQPPSCVDRARTREPRRDHPVPGRRRRAARSRTQGLNSAPARSAAVAILNG